MFSAYHCIYNLLLSFLFQVEQSERITNQCACAIYSIGPDAHHVSSSLQ